jgi:serine/threonine protein kinase
MEQFGLKRALGSGSYGLAIEVLQKPSKERYCIKQIDFQKLGLTYEAAAKEAEIHMKLKHPNIVQAIKYFKEDKFLCIVMELVVEGYTLNEKIKEHSSNKILFEETFIIDVFTQLTSALNECKQHNILHFDLKPDNFLITKEGQIKLSDFGVGRLLDSTYQQAYTFVGTPLYMAPEVLSNEPYSFAADVWSFGCVIYQLMTLKPPFDGTKREEIIQSINNKKFLLCQKNSIQN